MEFTIAMAPHDHTVFADANRTEVIFKHTFRWSGEMKMINLCLDQKRTYQAEYFTTPSYIVLKPEQYEQLIAEVSVVHHGEFTVPTKIHGMKIIVWNGIWSAATIQGPYAQYLQYVRENFGPRQEDKRNQLDIEKK